MTSRLLTTSVLLIAALFLLINLIVDLLYPVLDVRLRDQAAVDEHSTPAAADKPAAVNAQATTAKEAVR